MVTRIAGVIAVLLFNIVIARVLNLEEAGLFFFVFTMITILWNVSSMGMFRSLVKHISRLHDKGGLVKVAMLLNYSLFRVLVISIIFVVLVFVYTYISDSLFSEDKRVNEILRVMIYAVPFIAFYNIISYALQGISRPSISIAIQSIFTPVILILIVGVINIFNFGIALDYINLSYIFVLAAFVTFACSIYYWLKTIDSNKYNVKMDRNINFVLDSNKLFVMNIMGLTVQWSSILILGFFSSNEDVALYSIALRISMTTGFILLVINIVSAPYFAVYFENNNLDKLRKTMIFCNKLIIFLGMPALLLIFFYADHILILFGEEYLAAKGYLRVLIIGQLIMLYSGSASYVLNMMNCENKLRKISIITASTTICLGLVLVPIYEGLGAAITISTVIALQGILYIVEVYKTTRVNLLILR